MPISSNHVNVKNTLPCGQSHKWNNSSPPITEIVESIQTHGYAIVRGALPPDLVNNLRREFFAGFAAVGVTPDGLVVTSAQASAILTQFGMSTHRSALLQASNGYRELVEAKPLVKIAELLLACRVRLLPRQVLRLYTQFSYAGTMAHFDEAFVLHPPNVICNVWIPIGRASIETGTLVYLPKSHLKNVYEARDAYHKRLPALPKDGYPFGPNLDEVAASIGLGPWEHVDLSPGDVSIHHPRMLHASTDSLSDYARLVTDVRFAPCTWFGDHRWDDSWSSDDMRKWTLDNRPTAREA